LSLSALSQTFFDQSFSDSSDSVGCGTTKRPMQKFFSRSHDAVIRVYDAAGNVIETHEHKGDFNRSLYLLFGAASFGALDADRTSDRAGVVQEWQVRFKKHNSQDTSDRAFDNLGY